MSYSVVNKRSGLSSRISRRAVLAGGAAALSMPWISKAFAADKLTLRLDYTASGLHAPFYVALRKGWFEKAGVDLYMEDGNGSNVTVQLVGTGSFDIGLHSLAPMAVARSKGVPVISVAGFVRKGELGFLVPADSGWKTPKDLIGKKVAYGVTSQEGPFVHNFFEQNGVHEDQVELVNVDPASRYAVYFSKQVDALLTTVPGVLPIAASRRPSSAIVLSDFGLNIPGLGMSVRTDTLAKKKDAIRRLVSVVCGAWTYILDGREQEGADAVYEKKPEAGSSAAEMTQQIKLFKPFFYTEATKGLPIGVQSDADWAQTLKSMVDANVVPSGSKPSDYFTNDCVDKAIVEKIASNSF